MADVGQTKAKLNLSLDYRVISLVLILVVVAMLFVWKPWSSTPSSTDRTVTVSGEATLKAVPDQFVFYPSYQVENSDKQVAINDLSKKSEEIVGKLKDLGVAESAIQTNTSGYDYPIYMDSGNKKATYTLQLTITLKDQKLAQKAQDYLVTTSPTGSVSPTYSFSDAKRKSLESQARDSATKEARSKADLMGKNLGFKVGKVKAVTDAGGFNRGGIVPYDAKSSYLSAESASSTLSLHPGENELPYSVSVVYFIR